MTEVGTPKIQAKPVLLQGIKPMDGAASLIVSSEQPFDISPTERDIFEGKITIRNIYRKGKALAQKGPAFGRDYGLTAPGLVMLEPIIVPGILGVICNQVRMYWRRVVIHDV